MDEDGLLDRRAAGVAVGIDGAFDPLIKDVVNVIDGLGGGAVMRCPVSDFGEAVAVVPVVFGDGRVAGVELAISRL